MSSALARIAVPGPAVLLLLTIATAHAQPPTASRKASDDVVVTVGQIQITGRDLREEMNRLVPQAFFHRRIPQEQQHAMRAQAVENLVEKALIFQDAQARGITASDAELRAEFDKTLEVARKADPKLKDLPPAELQKLAAEYRPLVLRRILLDKNEARFTAAIPPVTDADMRARYEARKDQLVAPAEAHLLHLMVKVSPLASEADLKAAHKQVEDARQQIQGGASLVDLARKLAGDADAKTIGDLGMVQAGSFLRGALDAAAFALKDGELSGIIESRYGFHLVQCMKKSPPRQLTLDDARARLREEVATERTRELRNQWLSELKARFPVQHRATDVTGVPAATGDSRPASLPGAHQR